MRSILLIALTVTSFLGTALTAAEEIVLWPNGAPGSEGKTAPERIEKGNVVSVHKPSITVFLPPPDKTTGVAVLVIPGGGHRVLCVGHEGVNVAERLNRLGITAFMLKHRLAREEGSTYTIMDHAVPDAQRAIRLIRSRAAEWKIDPNKFGAMGFSAGGHLAAVRGKNGPGDVRRGHFGPSPVGGHRGDPDDERESRTLGREYRVISLIGSAEIARRAHRASHCFTLARYSCCRTDRTA